MSPASLATMRKAAVLAHAVSSLGAVIHDGERSWSFVSFRDVEGGVPHVHPCEFRCHVIAAIQRVSEGLPAGLLGAPDGVDLDVRWHDATDCEVRTDGLVSCFIEGGDVVLCFATLVDIEPLTALWTGAGAAASGITIEMCRDTDLGVTLVYHRYDPATASITTGDVEALADLAAAAGVEELTSPWSPYLATARP